MMNLDKLTQAEIDLIIANREADEKEKARLEAAAAERIQLKIERALNNIKTDQKNDALQVAATKEFFAKLNGISDTYRLSIRTTQGTTTVGDDDGNIVWSEVYDRNSAWIEFNSNQGLFKINVTEKFESGTRYRSGRSKGYYMTVSGKGFTWRDESRSYKNAKTIHDKITDNISSLQYKEDAENKAKSALSFTVDKFKELYPDASISVGYDFERSYYKPGSIGPKYDTVTVIFANGVSITWRVYGDRSLGRLNIHFPSQVKDQWALADTMSKIVF